jgi:hypothetical protein
MQPRLRDHRFERGIEGDSLDRATKRAVEASAALRARLCEDGGELPEAFALLAMSTARLVEISILYEDSEIRRGVDVSGEVSFLHRLGERLARFRKSLSYDDERIAELVDRVVSVIGDYWVEPGRSPGATVRVVEVLAGFRGTARELRRAIIGLSVAMVSAHGALIDRI